MRKVLSASLAGLMFAGLFSATVPASAQDLRIELGQNGPKVRVDDPERRREEQRRDRRDERRDDRRDARGCTEGRAVDKAERMGLRRARVDRVGRRSIEVRGRDRRGERRSITFGRERGCPVI